MLTDTGCGVARGTLRSRQDTRTDSAPDLNAGCVLFFTLIQRFGPAAAVNTLAMNGAKVFHVEKMRNRRSRDAKSAGR